MHVKTHIETAATEIGRVKKGGAVLSNLATKASPTPPLNYVEAPGVVGKFDDVRHLSLGVARSIDGNALALIQTGAAEIRRVKRVERYYRV